MPKLSGFQLLKTLSNRPKTIVTSAHKEYAIEGYELDIADYLLKPFSLERFLAAVNKAIGSTSDSNEFANKPVHHSLEEGSFFVKGDKRFHQVFKTEIRFIEAYGNYCKIHMEKDTLIVHESISNFELQLKKSFIRVHKSYIVAKDKISMIEGNRILLNKTAIPIGQSYRQKVLDLLKI